jgi:dTDP-glucose 4,6-dehydratase
MIAENMNAIVEVTSSVERLRPEKSEVERLWADNTKAYELFGWQPTYSGRDGFSRGLTETIAWFKQPENLRLYKSDIYNL